LSKVIHLKLLKLKLQMIPQPQELLLSQNSIRKNEKIEHIKNSTVIAKIYVDEFIDKILMVVITRGDSK